MLLTRAMGEHDTQLKQFHERHSAFYMAIIARMSHALKELNEEAMPGTVLAILKEALQEANDVNRFIYVVSSGGRGHCALAAVAATVSR